MFFFAETENNLYIIPVTPSHLKKLSKHSSNTSLILGFVTSQIVPTLISAIFQEPTQSPTFLSGKYLSSSDDDNRVAPILPCFILCKQ